MSRLATTLADMIDRAERDHDRSFHAVTIDTGMLRDLIRQDEEDPEDGSWLAAALRHACAVAALDQPLSYGLGITQPLAVSTVRALLDRHDAHHQSTRARIRYEVADAVIRDLYGQAAALSRAGLHVRAHEVRHQADRLRFDPDLDRARPEAGHVEAEVADLIDAANLPALADRIQETT